MLNGSCANILWPLNHKLTFPFVQKTVSQYQCLQPVIILCGKSRHTRKPGLSSTREARSPLGTSCRRSISSRARKATSTDLTAPNSSEAAERTGGIETPKQNLPLLGQLGPGQEQSTVGEVDKVGLGVWVWGSRGPCTSPSPHHPQGHLYKHWLSRGWGPGESPHPPSSEQNGCPLLSFYLYLNQIYSLAKYVMSSHTINQEYFTFSHLS